VIKSVEVSKTTKREYHHFPPYDPNNLDHLSLCLRLVFSGGIADANRGRLSFCILQHRGHFHRWFVKTFKMPITFYRERGLDKIRDRIIVRKSATHFLRQAFDQGWRFGKRHWRIPESVYQRHPLMILRHWVGLKARLFLFVTRHGNPNRTATTISFQTVNKDGAQRISQLLTHYNIVHHLACCQTPYFLSQTMKIKRKIKTLFILRIYGLFHTSRLFQLLGWERPEYAEPHHMKVLHQIVGSHLFPQRVSQFHKEGFYHEEKLKRNQFQTVSV